MVILVMGVSGSGKTTVGTMLAADLGWPYYDADDFHPPANVAKMARGEPLTDADRAPWLDALRRLIEAWLATGESAILGCSALKDTYRDRLLDDHPAVHVVYLKGDFATIQKRMSYRQGHFMKAAMLESQFAALEEPEGALVVDIRQTPEEIVAAIKRGLGMTGTE